MNNKKPILWLMISLIALSPLQALGKEPIFINESDAYIQKSSNENIQGAKDSIEQATTVTSSKEVLKSDSNESKIVEAVDDKNQKLEKRKIKKTNKHVDDYSEYLIPENGYQTVGNTEDKQIKIQGAISKTQELSLADCLELALLNNPKIKAAYASSEAVKETKVQTVSNYTPSLSTTTGITRIKPDLTGMPKGYHISPYNKYLLGTISLSQLVYDFGVTQNQYTINKLDFESSKQNIESVVNIVICDVKDAYYNLLFALSAKQVRKETVEQFEQTLQQAQAFYEVGMKPKVDVTIASSNLADAKSKYIEASNAVDLAVSKLNNAMGTPFIDPYVVNTSMPYQESNVTMKGAIEIANKARPDLKMALIEIQKADQLTKLAKKVYLPKLSVAADLSMGGRNDFADKTWYSLGGYLDFPVINPVKITSEIKQAKALLSQQKFDTQTIVNDIYFEIQNAFVKLTNAKEKIPASRLYVQQSRENYELSQGRYKEGVCDAIELKEAQLVFENAKLAYVSNIYEYNSAKALLEKAIGQSLAPSDTTENVEI